MRKDWNSSRTGRLFPATVLPKFLSAASMVALLAGTHYAAATVIAQPATPVFTPGNLVLSRSVYAGSPSSVVVGQTLPPGCVPGTFKIPLVAGGTTTVTIAKNSSSGCTTATNDGTYPTVFNNDAADGSFSISAPVFLDQLSPSGALINTLAIDPTQIMTSFESKSELALNLATDSSAITFVGYVGGPGYTTGPNQLGISNSNTPGVIDASNPDVGEYYRSVAEVDAFGNLHVTNGNAYSGDNDRAVVKAHGLYYMAGNDNNGGLSKTQLNTTVDGVNLVNSTGAELLIPGQIPAPVPPCIDKIGNFLIGQLGYTTVDKAGKDDNFRGLSIFNNTLYVTKGSGSNGINTVYQVGNAGVLPSATVSSPCGSLASTPITIPQGFPTVLASGTALNGTTNNPVAYPFGIWFANANTVYVADEGDGTLVNPPVNGNVADAQSQATAGLQKWILNPSTGAWQLVYILNNGLNIGVPYSITNGPNGEVYPTNLNPATGGLRNITGTINANGAATIWAVTSTLSQSGDQGADPNQLVSITDVLTNADPTVAAGEQFSTVRSAGYGELYRGISFTPGTGALPVTASGLLYSRVTRTFNGTLTVQNNTSSPIAGPINVEVKNLTPGVTLNGGTTTEFGLPAVQVVGSGSSLNPGQSVTAPISFSDPSNVTINFTPVPEY